MSVENLQEQLIECFNGAPDANVQTAAQSANQYTEMFKSGQLSKDEYMQLMTDIARTNEINKSATNIQFMEYMNTAINGLISLASAIG